MKKQRQMLSVYPPESVGKTLVKSTTTYNAALCCWASLIDLATVENESLMAPDVWDKLSRRVAAYDFTQVDEPAEALRNVMLRRPMDFSDQLIVDVWQLSYERAFALVWACWFHEAYPDVPEWWTLKARKGE